MDFAANCGAEKVHVIAHSCCARSSGITAHAETRGKVKFSQIFLAAPDVDRDLSRSRPSLPRARRARHPYSFDGDRAVHLASKLHDAPRTGYFTPYTVIARKAIAL